MKPKIVEVVLTVSTKIVATTEEEYKLKYKELEEKLEEMDIDIVDTESEETSDGDWFGDDSDEGDLGLSLWNDDY